MAPRAGLFLLLLPTLSYGYTWTFTNSPSQCSDVTISISGSGGVPPYRVLFIPTGVRPLPNNVEPRRIQENNFTGSDTTASFKVNYPVNSQFVAVVSDANGFGTGGTSGAVIVQNSTDASCFDSTTSVSPDFYFNLEPAGKIVQCTPVRLWWDKATVQGTPRFNGVIPGGQSFSIPSGSNVTDIVSQGTGFDWTPSVRAGTSLILVVGDNRGTGSAGSNGYTVQDNVNPISGCINDSSPSSTAGSPAGGSYPTSTSAPTNNNPSGGGGKSNIGAIVGGVVGGIVGLLAILLLLLFLRRRERLRNPHKEKPMDLIDGDNDGDDAAPGAEHRNELPQYYRPEPFMVPDPTVASTTDDGTLDDYQRPLSGITSERSGTPDGLTIAGTSQSGRKSAAGLRPLRPVNIIQHDDAGPSAQAIKEEETETIELPPAYTNIKA